MIKSQLRSLSALIVFAALLGGCVVPPPVQPASSSGTPMSAPQSGTTIVPSPVSTAPPAATSPAPAVPSATEPPPQNAEGNVLTPQQVSINAYGLPYSWQANLVPATPYDASQPPGPTGLPEHIVINFGVTNPQDRRPNDPIMYIIPVAAYEHLWDSAANPAVSSTMARIYSLTLALPAQAPTHGMPALPFEEIGGANDVAAQAGLVNTNAESASKNGYRFTGRWAQDANPVTANSLRYVYQGFTNDGRYLVAFFYPVTAPALPMETSAQEMEKFQQDPQAYIQQQALALNTYPPFRWQPDLTTLDKVVASLTIQGMLATGLQTGTWQWVGTTSPEGQPPVADPAPYQLVYGADMTLDVKADCTVLSGKYRYSGGMAGSTQADLGRPTVDPCGTNSLNQQFVQDVMAAQNFRLPPGTDRMELVLPSGGPTLEFRGTVTAEK